MQSPRIRLYQANCRDGDLPFNTRRVLDAIGASGGHTDLLVFPETFLQGFPTAANIAQLAIAVQGAVIDSVRAAARASGVSVAIGFAEIDEGRFFNTAVLIDATGQILLRYRKTHLYQSDDGVFEPGQAYPICVWQGIQVGLLICFDIEFPEAARALARQGAELIVLPDGNMDFSAQVHRKMIPVRALENQLFVVMANRVGAGERYVFAGESQAADPFGDCLAIAGAKDEAVLDLVLDIGMVNRARADLDYLKLAGLRRPAF